MKLTRARKRIGIFGGSFDPPHIGHCIIASNAAEQLGLHQVIFIPAFIPPHKKHRATSSARHRLAMTRRAVRGDKRFICSDLEVRRKGVSYTVDTVRAIQRLFPDAELFLLIGSDSLEMFPSWKEPRGILKMARLAVYDRPGIGAKGKGRRRVVSVTGPLMGISSSSIRTLAGQGKSIRFLVPASVERYIRIHRLYHRRSRS